MQLTDRYTRALDHARVLHADDVRKGTEIPYLSHVVTVSGMVLEYGGDEDQAIAALLHDAAEDHGGEGQLEQITSLFGRRVADIVRACSDSLVEDPAVKAPWSQRKAEYLHHLEHEPHDDALLVSAADKLHNCRAITRDYRRFGPSLWSRFNPEAGSDGTTWYYRRLAGILSGHLGADHDLAADLTEAVERLVALVGRDEPDLEDRYRGRCDVEASLLPS
jgi:hypothetical protein